MITDAMICTIGIFDSDGEESMTVEHTVSAEIKISQYGTEKLFISYDDARALAKALTMLITEPDLEEHGPLRKTKVKFDV